MKLAMMKRILAGGDDGDAADASSGLCIRVIFPYDRSGAAPPVLVSLVAVVACAVASLFVSMLLVAHWRKRRNSGEHGADPHGAGSGMKNFRLPTMQRPVHKFKSAAGPGGEKNHTV